MLLFFWIIIFIASLGVLIKASDIFTNSAEQIGLALGLPAFIIGVTVISVGTSMPELISSIVAVLKGTSEVVIGNVVGSNIANIFLVFGLTAIVGKKLKITHELTPIDLPLLVGSAFLMILMISDGVFTIGEALISLTGIIGYFSYMVYTKRAYKNGVIHKSTRTDLKQKKGIGFGVIFWLVVGSLLIYIGARYVIEAVIHLSSILNVGTEIIAVIAIALGTSLPELAVSLNAVRKRKTEIAIGNILGSNIFNTFAVMGIPTLFGNLIIPSAILSFSVPVMLVATLVYYFITQDKEVTKWEGWVLVLFYVFFVGKVVNLF